MRVLLVVLQYPPDVNSTGLLMEQVATGLVEKGHRVTVLTSFPHYAAFRVTPEYRGRLREREMRDGVEVIRWAVYARGEKRRGLHRMLSYLSFNAAAGFEGLLGRRRFDVVLATNGSFFTGLTGRAIASARRAPFVLNVQDLYPDVPIRAGQIRSPFAIAALRRLERTMLGRADHLAVITPSFRDAFLAKGVPARKVSVIPNFVDTDTIRPLAKDNPWAREHGLVDRFVAAHMGNVGVAYGLDTLLEVAARPGGRPDRLFLVVGEGVAKPALVAEAARRGLDHVRFLPFQPREALPWMRAAVDVHVALAAPGAAAHSMPSKVYEVMASGRPLLASAEPGTDVRALVEETGCGLAVDPADPDALAAALARLEGDPALRAEAGRRGREAAVARFSRAAAVDAWEALLARVAGERARPLAGAAAGGLRSPGTGSNAI